LLPLDHVPLQLVWLKGQARLEKQAGGKPTRLEPGTVLTFTRPGPPLRLHPQPGNDRNTTDRCGLVFTFTAPLAADYAGYLAEQFAPCTRIPARAAAIRAALALAKALDAKQPREILSRRIFDWFAALHSLLQRRRIHLDELLSGQTDCLPAIFEEHGHTLKGLAEFLGCSPNWLRQRLQRAWKRPAQDVLHELRRRHAWCLLATPSLSIGDVARRCGFSDTSSFASTFKKETGLTPTQARETTRTGMRLPPFPRLPASNPPPPVSPKRHPADGSYSPVAVWGEAFFQFDGGVSGLVYESPFDLALNTVTNAVYWVVTLEGEAVFEAGTCRLPVKPGMVVVYPQPMNGRWITPGGAKRPWKRLWINARCKWGIDALLRTGEAHGWAAMLPMDSEPVMLATKWVDYWHTRRTTPSLVASRAGFEWLQSWWRLLCSGQVKPVVGENHAALPNLRHLLSKSFFRQIKTITEYARQLGYSRRHAIRKLRTQWDDATPARVIRRQRLAQAKLDLLHTRLSVGDIARKSLFASPGSFIPAFKKEFGMTPLAWRLARL
jgi:AraC-like DNA-binding protein